MSEADRLLDTVYNSLGIANLNKAQKYQRINDIVDELGKLNINQKINGKTTGTISERLCELALESALGKDSYETMGQKWKWIGDFSIAGKPFNVIVSVKSFKAKERLISSGSGHILSPTIGWGLFNDPKEWGDVRTKSYVFRAFTAIYMPQPLYNKLSVSSKAVTNLNGKLFLRTIDDFAIDLSKASIANRIDITKI